MSARPARPARRPRSFPALKFVRKLPPKSTCVGRFGFWQDALKQLSRRRGRWARVGSASDYKSAWQIADRAKAAKQGKFEITLRNGALFMRRAAR